MAKQALIDALNNLPAAERAEVLTLVAYAERPEVAEFTADELLVWDEINRLLHASRPIARFFATSGNHVSRDQYADDVEELVGFVARGCRVAPTKTEKLALIHTSLVCLKSYLEHAGAPIMHRTIVRNLEKIIPAVDRAFPGYASAGLLRLVVRPVVSERA